MSQEHHLDHSMEDVAYKDDENVFDRVGEDYPELFEDSELEEDPTYTADDDDANSSDNSSEKDSNISGGESSEDDEEWLMSRQKIIDLEKNEVENYDIQQHCSLSNGTLQEYCSIESDDEYLLTLPRSDEDDDSSKRERVAFKVESEANLKRLVWRVGMKFSAPEIFKEQVIRYGAYAGYCIRWTKNAKNEKLAARCKQGCPWKIYASWDGKRESFVVKSVHSTHTCDRQDFENVQVSPRFLAKFYMEKYKKNPGWSRKSLQGEVLLKFGKRIKRHACYAVKKYAFEAIYGSISEHYKKLGSYMAKLERADNGIHIELVTEKRGIPRAPDIFKRMYISFPALREGFSRGCRPLMCLDGCFLKTYLGGILLCAIGRDGNNQMFPIAWVVVEAENNSSWSWFLDILKRELPGFGGGNCTVSSDKKKGLCNAVKEHFPNVEHRNCARHIFANWHKKNKGDELKMHFWRAARAYTKADYEAALAEMGKVSKSAVTDFVQKDPSHFCRSHLKTGSKSEVIVNNLTETFNGFILEERGKPLIDMLGGIMLRLMERLWDKSLLMRNNKMGDLCPKIRVKLDKEKIDARECASIRASEAEFQVTRKMDMFSVNIVERSCSCRKWDLTGIPCCHAISSLNSIRVEPERVVHEWFKKEMYEQAYKGSIRTIRGEKHWPKVAQDLDPPKFKVPTGRPKKNRRKDACERFDKKGKLSNHGIQMTCTLCQGKNHNKRSCPQKNNISLTSVQAPQVAKPRGRPRKDGAPSKKASETSQVDPNQPKRKRGRPKKVVPTSVPTGRGIYIVENERRTYVNPDQLGGYVLSQSEGAPGPSQTSK